MWHGGCAIFVVFGLCHGRHAMQRLTCALSFSLAQSPPGTTFHQHATCRLSPMGSGGGGYVARRLRLKQPAPAWAKFREPLAPETQARGPSITCKARRSQANTRVQLFGERVQCSPNQHAVLKSRMLALRALRSDWTVQRWKQAIKRMMGSGGGGYVARRLRQKQPGPAWTKFREPLAPETQARGPSITCKARRTQANTRVQLFGERVQCGPSQRVVLKSRMLALRASRSDWTVQRWKQSVKRMAAQGWGTSGHGGARKKPASAVEGSGSAQGTLAKTVGDAAAAVSEHCGGMFTKAVGDTSAVGEPSGGAQRALAKTGGALSAIGEGEVQRGVEEDVHSQTECVSKHSDRLPVIVSASAIPPPESLPLVRAQTSLCGYKVVELMSGGSFGDVYKVRKNGSGEWFAVKVMVKSSRTAQRSKE